MEVSPDTPESDERCRSIEPGARLVTVMPSAFALVMQMPRGNLETIYPRALVLTGIRQSIIDHKYRKAFLACRNQRVDMNILHDHAPDKFITNVGLFLDQVHKVEHIDLFLSQLRYAQSKISRAYLITSREEDVSETMYRETLHGAVGGKRPINLEVTEAGDVSKINRICDAFLKALAIRGSAHIQNVVTAHVCKVPPDLDAGLNEIANIISKSPLYYPCSITSQLDRMLHY